MEFDGDAGMPLTSIYDKCFLNEVFIDRHLSFVDDKEIYKKVGLLGLMCIQQALSLRCPSISRNIKKEV